MIADLPNMASHLSDDNLALADHATVAATRFDATEASGILPFAPLLLRGESVASSRIEQLTSSSRKVMEAELLNTPTGSTGNAALIAAATAQMTEAIGAQELPSLRSILTMHDLLLGPSAPSIAGTLREDPVWIGGGDNDPVDAQFVPPTPCRVPKLMDDLVEFMSRQDIPALVLAAVSHAQFETIHPFVDGNGRTGRALMHRILRARGVSRNGTLPLAAGILEDPGAYFSALDAYRDGDINAIVRLISRSALRGAELGEWLGAELSSIRRSWDEDVHARRDAADWKILDILIRQPVVDAERISGELGISQVNSRRALDRLEDDGVLRSAQITKGRRAWRSPEVLDLLDEFSERAGRRGTP